MATFANRTTFNTTQYLKLSTGNTAQRPASPTAGQMRFNTDTDSTTGRPIGVEQWNGSSWVAFTEQAAPKLSLIHI